MSCASPATWETLVAYWAGELDATEEDTLEAHLMGCDSCTTESARIASVTETLRAMIPPVVTRARVDHLRAKGLRMREDVLAPGDSREVIFPSNLDLLILRLGGLDLSGATKVGFEMRVHGTTQVLVTVPDVPFERAEGAVLLVCQQHYAALPPHVDAELRVRVADGSERVARYTIDHRFA
jgi:anti-sigma factor RsiW